MLLISDKGNISGYNSLENTQEYIQSTIDQGYNVKIDLWYRDNKCYLGTDSPDTEIEWSWLLQNSDYLWVKCSDTETFSFLLENGKSLNFFYNKNDIVTLTSKGVPWTYSGNKHIKGTMTHIQNVNSPIDGVLGICSDHVSKWSKQIAVCFYGDTGLSKNDVIINHKNTLIDRLEAMGFHLEYYGSKLLNPSENDLEYGKIYKFKGLRSHLTDSSKSVTEMEEKHIKSIYEMIGSHPYETAFFVRWDQILTDNEIIEHIKNI
jgi:hypothetical protein|tara:strand:+ start:1177 stop:1962 length:786 start_codon:yes stop_codon:yes gene_type:complete